MTTKDIAARLFPTKSYSAVVKQRHFLRSGLFTNRAPSDERQSDHGAKWQPADIELLGILRKDGASLHKLCAHFATRSPQSINAALHNFVLNPKIASHRARPWSEADEQYLTKLVLQGANGYEVAKALGRTARAVWRRAYELGVRFNSNRMKHRFSAEEKIEIFRMRIDGATFGQIGAALGCDPDAVKYRWYQLGPETHDSKVSQKRGSCYPPTHLNTDDYQTIFSLRDQATPWSSIGSLFPQYQLDSIRQDFWRFTKGKLSSTDLRTIQSLRRGGKSWQAIVDTGDYSLASGSGLHRACNRMMRNE
ncbi:hypothetical protein Q7P35_011385 [Cladosporium inversicolor]